MDVKVAKTFIISLSVLLLTACSNIGNTTSEGVLSTSSTTETTTETDIHQSDTTLDTITTTESPNDSSITTDTSGKTSTDVSVTGDTSIDTTTVTTTTTTTTSTTYDTEQATTTVTDTTTTANTLPIPTYCTSEYISQEICKEVSEYFDAMISIDTDTFLSKQLPEYNSFMDNYLTENSSNTKDMLTTYYENFLKSSDAAEDTPYTSVEFNSIDLDYPNDFDSIMNTMDYINQLDEVTLEYGEYTLSDELSAYYELVYTIDYTLHGEDVEDFNGTKSGNILVLVVGSQIYLIMLS